MATETRPYVTPHALASFDRAREYVLRDRGSEPGAEDWLSIFLNEVTGKIEAHCGRRLACRTYRDTTAITCTSTANSTALTAASGFLALKTLDDAVGAKIAPGSQIESITSDGALVLTRKAPSGAGAGTVTFGSEALFVDGQGTDLIAIPEYPVVELYAVSYLGSDGTETAIDLTGARLIKRTGHLRLMLGTAPWGQQNIKIECKAGYRQPTATDRGDWEDWSALESATLRWLQVLWQDYAQQVGRSGDISLIQATQRAVSLSLPRDIRDALSPYRRLW